MHFSDGEGLCLTYRLSVKGGFASLLFSMEDFGEEGSSDLHCALGAELLTAEATNAIAAVYHRLAALYLYSLGGANIFTHAAAYAQVFF